MDIRCRKTTCEFNNNHTCLAKEITINAQIQCASYHKACEFIQENAKKHGKKMIDLKSKQESSIDDNKVGHTRKHPNPQAFIEHKTIDTSRTMFQKPPKNAPFRNRKTIRIDCKTNCLFNQNGICRANGITVNDLGEPYCMGYLKK